MAARDKLITKLLGKPTDFTWKEVVALMKACNFSLHTGSGGSGRMFVHKTTRTKVRLHEPHPEKTLKPYMVDRVIEGLQAAGEIE